MRLLGDDFEALAAFLCILEVVYNNYKLGTLLLHCDLQQNYCLKLGSPWSWFYEGGIKIW